jgi:hypothetical protein
MVSLANMPSVASGIAAGKQDGFIFGFGFSKGFVAPGVPIDRVVGVLEEIRGGFVDQAVGVLGFGHFIDHPFWVTIDLR